MSNDPVNHPSHYTGWSNGAEIVDITENLNFNRGNAVKYIARAGRKDPEKELEDLRKAEFYLQREIGRMAPVNVLCDPFAIVDTDDEPELWDLGPLRVIGFDDDVEPYGRHARPDEVWDMEPGDPPVVFWCEGGYFARMVWWSPLPHLSAGAPHVSFIE